MSLTRAFKTDGDLEVNGVSIPLEDSVNEDGSVPTFIVGRTSKSNKQYQAALTKATAPLQRAIQLKQDVGPQLEKAFLEAYCGHIVRGWSNVLLSDVTGNPDDTGFAEFSKANAIKLFTRLPDVYDYLAEQSNNISLFLEATREESAKN